MTENLSTEPEMWDGAHDPTRPAGAPVNAGGPVQNTDRTLWRSEDGPDEVRLSARGEVFIGHGGRFVGDTPAGWLRHAERPDYYQRTYGIDPHPEAPHLGPFEFSREHDGSLSLNSAVFQALGYASVCWERMEGTGVFQSDLAASAGAALLAEIDRQRPPADAATDDRPEREQGR